MKKLFSSMLAATMVAGMAVTAFATIDNTEFTGGDKDSFKGQDYAVIGAYDEDGNKVKDSNKPFVDGGDKLYFPILISGEELDDDDATSEQEENMYFVTKRSDIDDLKASVKDEVGGKYIDNATIVKKDINISDSGKTGVKGVDGEFKVVLADDTKLAADSGQTATVTLAIGSNSVASADLDLSAEKDAAAIAEAFEGKTITIDTVVYTAKVSDKTITFEAPDDTDVTVPTNDTKVEFSVSGTTATLDDAQTSSAKNGVKAVGALDTKIYCVEVEMSDYYKSEETEVEFNITLKNSGRKEFDSEDDKNKNYWVADFDLGQDSKTLKDEKESDTNYGYDVEFDDDGDLELEIGPDTRSVQLDEAIDGKGDKYDIETIFLESSDQIDCAFTFDVKASDQDDLYLELNDDAVKDLAVSNQKADLTFFNFPGEPEFDFSGDATFAVEDDDEDYYFYEIVDGELVETNAKYDSRDGVFKLRTNKLGSYVISDKELDTAKEEDEKDVNDDETKPNENGGGDATADAATPSKNAPKANANTGAADLIGVASALAVVSVAAAGAVALKK